MSAEAHDQWWTAEQVAEFLQVHVNTVYDLAKRGEIPSFKIGGSRRFDPVELRAYLERRREESERIAPVTQLRHRRR